MSCDPERAVMDYLNGNLTMVTIICDHFLGQIPLDTELAKLCDDGQIERYESELVESLSIPLE